MIWNYMACSIQNYGSDAFRFTLRIRSVIHIRCTAHPSRKTKSRPVQAPGRRGTKGWSSPLHQAFPTCRRTLPGTR